MHIMQALLGVWILCGVLAFGLHYTRHRRAGRYVGNPFVQFAASILLGGIALVAVLKNDD